MKIVNVSKGTTVQVHSKDIIEEAVNAHDDKKEMIEAIKKAVMKNLFHKAYQIEVRDNKLNILSTVEVQVDPCSLVSKISIIVNTEDNIDESMINHAI